MLIIGCDFHTRYPSTNGQLQVWEKVNLCPIQGRTPGGGANVGISTNLTLQTASFTTQVAGGTATFTAVVTIGAAPINQLPVTFTLTRSAASNPNGVLLDIGSAAANGTCTISASAGNCNVPFPVASSANNTHAGAVTWQFTASTTNTNYGSSGAATPAPNPLVGTVNFTN